MCRNFADETHTRTHEGFISFFVYIYYILKDIDCKAKKHKSFYQILVGGFLMEMNTFYQYPTFLDLFDLTNDEKMTFVHIYDLFKISKKNDWKDTEGRIFVQASRKYIASKVHRSVATTIKYIKKLARLGLIFESWSGQGSCKKIYIPEDFIIKEYKSKKENTAAPESAAKNNRYKSSKKVKSNNSFDTEKINDVKNIIRETISNEEIQDILRASKCDLNVIQEAYTYTKSKRNIKDLTAYLIETINNGWYKHIPTSSTNDLYFSKPSKFVNFKQRDWNFNALEELERLKLKEQLGEQIDQDRKAYLIQMLHQSK